jgi:hypothetical protein
LTELHPTAEPISPATAAAGRAPRRHRRTLGTGLIALVALAAMALLFDVAVIEHHDNPSVAGPDLARLVAQDIQARTSSAQLPAVTCPSIRSQVGTTVVCQADIDGKTVAIRVRALGGQDNFSVNFPGD